MKTNKKYLLIPLFFAALVACASEAPEIEILANPQREVEDVIVSQVTNPEAQVKAQGDVPGDQSPLAFTDVGNRLVIKDAELELLIGDTDKAINQVTKVASDYGGYIIGSRTWYSDEYKHASLKLGIPAANFEEALTELRRLGLRVLQETASGQDVTAEYVDLESKLTNLEATAVRVRNFLDSAQNLDEVLRINQELSDLEAQIEQVRGQMRFYEGRAAFSTVTVILTPERPEPEPTPTPTPAPAPIWDPSATFDQASTVLVNGTQKMVDALIWVVVLVGPIAIVIAFVVWIIRRGMRLGKRTV
jgi:hypothetical protein